MRQHLAKSPTTLTRSYRFPGVVQNAVVLGDIMVCAFRRTEPGWRWSKDSNRWSAANGVMLAYVGTIVSDEFVFMLPDGTRTELHPGDVYDIPPGHDGFTLGDEAVHGHPSGQVFEQFAGFRAGVGPVVIWRRC
jgi:hypothetical protein